MSSVAVAMRAAVATGASIALLSGGLAPSPAAADLQASSTPSELRTSRATGGETFGTTVLMAAAKLSGKRVTKVNLNLRTGPSLRQRVIKVLRKGTVVTLSGRRTGNFVSVKVGSRKGWVAARYLARVPRKATPKPASTAKLRTVNAFITGYTWYDNSPPGSAAIARPVIHRRAGGVGTYADPITMAVGYTSRGMDIRAGTRFYLPRMKKYFIVEDKCGACHRHTADVAYKLDIWLDGRNRSRTKARSCAYSITGKQPVVRAPQNGLPVKRGSVC